MIILLNSKRVHSSQLFLTKIVQLLSLKTKMTPPSSLQPLPEIRFPTSQFYLNRHKGAHRWTGASFDTHPSSLHVLDYAQEKEGAGQVVERMWLTQPSDQGCMVSSRGTRGQCLRPFCGTLGVAVSPHEQVELTVLTAATCITPSQIKLT